MDKTCKVYLFRFVSELQGDRSSAHLLECAKQKAAEEMRMELMSKVVMAAKMISRW
jgi:hypothetical protein